MAYRWQDCYCRECECMDMEDAWKYDSSKRYCSERREYYNPNEQACSRMKYDEKRNPKPSSPCYLTTMINNILGMPDDGYTLNTLRSLRDNYMLKHPETYPMLLEYDIIGPRIAKKLQNDPINIYIAREFYNSHILPVTEDVLNRRYEEAIAKYQEMTYKLKNHYNIDDTITEEIKVNIKTLGKARA